MGKTPIEWTDESINPIRARIKGGMQLEAGGILHGAGHYCEKVSPGCANCYASRMQVRFGMPAFPSVKGNLGVVEPYFDDSRLMQVLRRKKPTKYFWCDMTDMFGHWVPDEWIDKCFAVMALTPQHIHQVLTKRPERMAGYLNGGSKRKIGPGVQCDIAWAMSDVLVDVKRITDKRYAELSPLMGLVDSAETWPLPNVWLGTSCEDQKAADERVPHLLNCPAVVRFLSVEPLLGPVDLTKIQLPQPDPNAFIKQLMPWQSLDCINKRGFKSDGHLGCFEHRLKEGIHWVILGGESGPGARVCTIGHIREIVQQCEGTGVACFVKQLGSNARNREGEKHPIKDHHNIDEFPPDLRVREYPEVRS